MPIFEYVCKQCRHSFEAIVRGPEKPHCPVCGSPKLQQELSVFAVGAPKSQTSASPRACGTCGDPRGPGACAIED
jgi:putative FmdB family regulatory protein